MILKALVYIIKYTISTPGLIANWLTFRFTKKHLKYQKLQLNKYLDSGKFAIIAVYPGTSTLKSLRRQIQMFEKNKFNVYVVLNENSKSLVWAKTLIDLNCTVLHRSNLGADFAAYKVAMCYIQNQYQESIKELVITNDSIFLGPNSAVAMEKLLQTQSQFNCLFYHKQSVRHASSMFIKFDHSILVQDNFWYFWKKYYPYILKNQVVRKGEHRLTEVVGHEYFKPFVNLDILNKHNAEMESSEVMQALVWAQRSNIYIYNLECLVISYPNHLMGI